MVYLADWIVGENQFIEKSTPLCSGAERHREDAHKKVFAVGGGSHAIVIMQQCVGWSIITEFSEV